MLKLFLEASAIALTVAFLLTFTEFRFDGVPLLAGLPGQDQQYLYLSRTALGAMALLALVLARPKK